jgi:hypothetical protein
LLCRSRTGCKRRSPSPDRRTGPADRIGACRQEAAGIIPWVFDHDRLEENWFHLLMAPPAHLRAGGPAGARILARRLREAA